MLKLLISITFTLVALSFQAFSAAPMMKLSEKALEDLSSRGVPGIDEIEAAFLNASVREGETNLRFAPEIFGKGAYSETNERAIIQFQPVFSPIKQAQLGVRKNFKEGFETQAYVSTDQRSAVNPFIGKIQNATTTTLAFTAQMDIWKNVLGRNTKREVESAELEKKRAELQKQIQLRTFQISLRRIYWSLVANNESINISDQLLKTAEQQLSESKRRFKDSVAEADEVARYEAQLANRQGTRLYYLYQKETFIKQLRNLLPDLSTSEIVLDDYDLKKTISEVLVCTATIAQQPSVPYQYTQYDEIVSMLRQIRSNNSVINSRFADPDVKLYGTVKSTGVGSDSVRQGYVRGNFGDSLDDQTEQNRTGYEVGVNFSIPLGDTKESTQKVKELYDEKRLQASINSTDAQVVSTHQQLSKSIALLTDVIRAQRMSSEQLSKRLAIMRKKYQQARVSVDQLVLDQDALLNSELTTIDIQLQILNTLFDYLVVYTETPCPFNRI